MSIEALSRFVEDETTEPNWMQIPLMIAYSYQQGTSYNNAGGRKGSRCY